MTGLVDTIATMDDGLKTDHLDRMMIDAIYHGSNVNIMFKERGGSRTVGGKSLQALWPVDSEQGFGAGGLSENGDLAFGYADFQKTYTQTLADYSFSAEISRRAVATAAKQGASYLGDILARKLRNVANNSAFLMGTRAFQDGTGLIAQITAVSSNTLTIGTDGVKWLRRGMRISVNDQAGGGGTEQLTNPSDGTTDGGHILEVDREAGTITIEDASTAVSLVNDYVFIADMVGNTEIEGLQSIISQTGTFQGLNRATAGNGFAKSWRVNGGASPLTITMLMQARNRIPQMSPTGEGDPAYVCSYDTTIDIDDLQANAVRYTTDSMIGDKKIGFETVAIYTPSGTATIVPDRFCIDNVIYAMVPEVFGWMHPEGQEGGKWVDEDGTIWKLKNSSTAGRRQDTLQAYRDLRTNLYCDEPQKTVLLDNWT